MIEADDALLEEIRADLDVLAQLTRDGPVKRPARTTFEEVNFHGYMLEMAHQRIADHNPALAKIQPLGTPVEDEIRRHRHAMLHIRLYAKQPVAADFLMPDEAYGEQTPMRG